MSRLTLVSMGILIFIFVLFVCSGLGFIVGLPLESFYGWVAIWSICIGFYLMIKEWRDRFLCFFLLLLIIGVSFAVSILLYDSSVDGRWYHQIAMIYLKNGWNPIYQSMQDMKDLKDFLSAEIWIENYGKFYEIVGANFYLWTDKIESTKAVNVLLAISSMLYAYGVFSYFGRRFTFVFAFLLAFSPVVMAQIFTNYIDGALSSLALFVICAIVALETRKMKMDYFVLFASFVMLSSVKLTGIAYSGVIGIAYLTYLFFFDKKRMFGVLKCCIASFFLFILCNINPYGTNLIRERHVFYPLMGENKIDIITPFMEKEFAQKNRIQQLFISIFAKTQNITIGSMRDKKPDIKLPLTFGEDEQHINVPDMRIGGFGFLFGGIVIVSLLCLISSFYRLSHQEKRIIFLITILIGSSVLINPALWWARYVPQLWFLPLIFLFFSIGFVRFLPIFGVLIVVLNIGDSALFSFGRSLFYSANLSNILNQVKNEKVDLYFSQESSDKSFMIKLQEHKIPFSLTRKEMLESLDKIPTNSLGDSYWSVKNDKLQFCNIDKNQVKSLGITESVRVFFRCFLGK